MMPLHDVISPRAMSSHAMSCHMSHNGMHITSNVTQCYVMSHVITHHITSHTCHLTLLVVSPSQGMPYHAISLHVMSQCKIICQLTSHDAVPCHVTQFHAMQHQVASHLGHLYMLLVGTH